MPRNHLEDLVAEWYEYQGFFVRRNVLVGKRARGGHECELDVVALHPEQKRLVHIEPSLDADSWAERERRYSKKFEAGRKYIPSLFKGLELPTAIEQIALFAYGGVKGHEKVGGGRVVRAGDLVTEVFVNLKDRRLASSAIPEHLPILRSFQYVLESWSRISIALGRGKE